MEKEREKNSAPPHRRAQKVMIRSSSDSSYVSGSPGGSPVSGCEPQPSDPEVPTDSPSPSQGQEPGTLPTAPSRPPQESPPLPGTQDSHPPLKLKKSFEILVRKPTTSKPKPPPRKYFKSDSDPQKSLVEREDALGPSGHTVPPCGQVRDGSGGPNVLLSSRARGVVLSLLVWCWSSARSFLTAGAAFARGRVSGSLSASSGLTAESELGGRNPSPTPAEGLLEPFWNARGSPAAFTGSSVRLAPTGPQQSSWKALGEARAGGC